MKNVYTKTLENNIKASNILLTSENLMWLLLSTKQSKYNNYLITLINKKTNDIRLICEVYLSTGAYNTSWHLLDTECNIQFTKLNIQLKYC